MLGREHDLREVTSRLMETRLVTLWGPGGVGKTRLAHAIAGASKKRFAARDGGGVWIVDLAAARTTREVVTRVATTLGLDPHGAEEAEQAARAVGVALARRGAMLVVLDDFEHAVAAAPDTVAPWTRLAPRARWLVTSRVPLEIDGEVRWPLEPLPREEAIALFRARLAAVRPEAAASADEATIGAIVEAIDRMPLAIELAATRAAVLALEEIHARAVQPLALLTSARDGKHGSVARAIEGSLSLVDEATRDVLAGLAVLRNGADLALVEEVLGDVVVPRAEVLPRLEALVRHSLVTRSTDVRGKKARFSLYETIREAAAQRLATRKFRAALEERHRRHHASRVLSLDHDTLASLEAELFAAHASAVAAGDPVALTLALGLDPLLAARGLSIARAKLLDEALAVAADASPSARGAAHVARGAARRELGDPAGAAEDFEHARALGASVGDEGLVAVALTRLAHVHDHGGDTARAIDEASQALACLERTPLDALRTRREAEAYLHLGHARRREGALGPAREAIVEAIARARRVADDAALASGLYELGVIEMFAGELDRAAAHLEEGLGVATRAGAAIARAALTTALGGIAQERGELEAALARHAEAARLFRDVGSGPREASALYYLATTHLERGDAVEAEHVLLQARARLEGAGALRYDALISSALAVALEMQERAGASRRELGRARQALAGVPSEPALACTVHVHGVTVSLRERAVDAEVLRAQARREVASASNDDSRFALRILERQLAGARAEATSLVVQADGGALRFPDGTQATLPARSPQRRILAFLARRRVEAPGEGASIDEIIAAGWPGEQIVHEAALNRAYVALAGLRGRGLRALLVREGAGYALTQAVTVRLEPRVENKAH
ncbi:MAG: NB-ARC domain-containing protein [Sandaracinus sp.]